MSDESQIIADRRQNDTVVDMLRHRIDSNEKDAKDNKNEIRVVSDALFKHVAECSANSKQVKLGVILIGGWLVGHSQEAAKLFGPIIKLIVP